MCVEQQIAHLAPTLARKKTSVHPSGQKKQSGLGQEEFQLMQALKRGFRGLFFSFWLDSSFWCAEISQRISNSRTCWA
jgi:hypothetical protein